VMIEQAKQRFEGGPYLLFHRFGERIQSFGKAWNMFTRSSRERDRETESEAEKPALPARVQ